MKIIICIVLYENSFSKSRAINSLLGMQSILKNVNVEIYLNGDCEQDSKLVNQLFNIHDNQGANLFLLENYLDCINLAAQRKEEWIIFFDQDTEITHEYFSELLQEIENSTDQVAFYPQLMAREKAISPIMLTHGSSYPLKPVAPGEYTSIDFVGLNSGSIYKVDYLSGINFDSEFQLDFLDCFISYRVFKDKAVFKVLKSTLEHDLSVNNNEPLGLFRARSILSAENYYYKTYRTFFENFIYKIRLCVRLIKSFFNKNYLYQKSLLIEHLFK